MGQRGPKSANDLAVAPAEPLENARSRPVPPEGFGKPEADIWRRIVAAMPASWFKREHLDMLARYCQHQVRAERFNRWANATTGETLNDGFSLEDFDRLCRMAERESRASLALARSMRITHQAQLRAETAGTRNRNRPDIPATWNGKEGKPWE